MRIHLTQEHIDRGLRRQCNSCPGALAINDVLKNGFYSVVSSATVGIYERDGDPFLVDTPAALRKFVDDFDFRRPVAPISFELPIDEFCKEPERV